MNIADIAKFRYATKKFDKNKKIPNELFTQIKELLRFSPSSVNVQPWHFVIANTDSGKMRISNGAKERFSYNVSKIVDASHVILFCAKTQIDTEYMTLLLESEEQHGRYSTPEAKEQTRVGRAMYINMHRFDYKDAQHWMEKQLYLNIGTVLLGAASLGIDAVPMEGFDPKKMNEEFGLLEKGYTAVAIVALGYRDSNDFNAGLPKSRLPEEKLFTRLP